MVLSLDLAFQNAISGLNTAQGNIAITSQNISNAHTEGYSRKQAELSTRITAGVATVSRLKTSRVRSMRSCAASCGP